MRGRNRVELVPAEIRMRYREIPTHICVVVTLHTYGIAWFPIEVLTEDTSLLRIYAGLEIFRI